ncbi:hypothetical protein EMCRGX_G014037 [Ephydatia muelleri]|eukprot:Em0004g1604a
MRLLLVFGPVSYFILILTSNATQGLSITLGLDSEHSELNASTICSGSIKLKNPPIPAPPFNGEVLTTSNLYGKLTSNSSNLSSCYWKISCPDTRYLIVVVKETDLAPGDYLQLNRTIQFSECIDQPAGYMFKKKQIEVSSATGTCNAASTFEVLYLCCARSLCQQASLIILNQDVLRYIQQHDTAFNKVAALHADPASVGLAGLQDQELATMLGLAGFIRGWN